MSLEAFSDEALLVLAARGEEAALQQIFRRYAGAFLGLSRRMGLDSASQEDVVQEVFSKIWKNAREFNPQRASARAWLLAIAHHTTVDFFTPSRSPAPGLGT